MVRCPDTLGKKYCAPSFAAVYHNYLTCCQLVIETNELRHIITDVQMDNKILEACGQISLGYGVYVKAISGL